MPRPSDHTIAKWIGGLALLTQRLVSSVACRRESIWYFFEEAAGKYPDNVSIWSREGCHTAKEVYEHACQYATFFLNLGVKPGELVAFDLQNQPEFIFAWLGLWAIVGSLVC